MYQMTLAVLGLVAIVAIIALPISLFVVLDYVKKSTVLGNGVPAYIHVREQDQKFQHEIAEQKYQHEYMLAKAIEKAEDNVEDLVS